MQRSVPSTGRRPRAMTSARLQPAVVPHGTTLPPPAPGVRYVSVPLLGIVISDDKRRRRVDRFFHWPMIILALAILPLLAIELFHRPEGWQRWALDIGFGLTWLAFLVEFVIKVAIAESRIEYARRNWLDIVIILVPVLRPLRAAAVVRTTRVFKLRGIAMKCARSVFTVVVGLEATDRLLRRLGLKAGKEHKRPETMTRHQLMSEVRRLRKRDSAWERWHHAHEEHVATYGGACFVGDRPAAEDAEERDETDETEDGAEARADLPLQ